MESITQGQKMENSKVKSEREADEYKHIQEERARKEYEDRKTDKEKEADKEIRRLNNAAFKKVKIVRNAPNTTRCPYSYNMGRRNRGETLEEYLRGGKF